MLSTLRYFGEVGQRVASKFWVEDRVFIARDAFHTHSPKAGWRSSIPVRLVSYSHPYGPGDEREYERYAQPWGWANPSILKTYTQDLIDFDKRYAALFSGKPRTSADQNGISHEEFFKAYKTAGGFTSGTGIHYGPCQNHWYGKKLTDYAQEERYEWKSSWPMTATEIEDADVWGDSDEANHGADKRFAMLCGRWSTAWKVAKELARQERRETMESEKAEKPSGSSSLQRLTVLWI
ncbi:hypothetical protein EV401DRAFT_2200454 [Pisolithus croceorrhizus]|nr:hypothetical protein EV401DRAFT_2200454 [Pisolithus croceorrhizus]